MSQIKKKTIGYNNTASLISFHKIQPEYICIVCTYIVYILLLIAAMIIICLLA